MAATKTGNFLKTISPKLFNRVVSTSSTNAQSTAPSLALDRDEAISCRHHECRDVSGTSGSPVNPVKEKDTSTIFRNTFPQPDNMPVDTAPKTAKLKTYKEIPGPKGLPMIGTLLDYATKFKTSKMFEVYQARAIEYGPIYKEKIGHIKTVVISDPEEYSKVIRAEGRCPVRRELEPIANYRRYKKIDLGLVNDQGENWHRLRTVTAPKMLMMKEVQRFCEPMNDVGNEFIQHLTEERGSDNAVAELDKKLLGWAFESIGTFLFEDRIRCFSKESSKATEFLHHLQKKFAFHQPLMFNVPLYKICSTKLWKKFEFHSDKVYELGSHFINKKVDQIEAAKNNPSSVENKDNNESFIEYMMSQDSITSEDALATCVDLLIAATETTSNAMLWTLYCLAQNPEVQEKLYQETQKAIGDSEDINVNDLSKLTYVKAVLKESFRRYPITWATSRVTPEPMEICGHEIPKGTHVQANLFGMYRDEKLFPDNESFKPERWLRENKMDTQLKSLSNLIWGHGARMCIGRRFAEQELHIILTKIIQNFKLEYDGEPIEPVLNTVMIPDRDVNIKFIPRS